MAAAALPIAIGASGALSYFSAKNASKLSPVEKQSQQQQLDASRALTSQGTQLSGYGMPKLQQAGNYFSSLASGNRAQTAQTLAPEVQNINDVYGGTQRTLSRFLRGPDRDYQMGELSRNRANAIGGLFRDARDKGVAGLVNLGQYGTSQGTAALTGGAGIAGGVSNTAMNNRYAGAQLQSQAGSDTAALIFQLLKAYATKAPGGARIPSVGATGGIPAGAFPSIPGTSGGG
jgi:hypothetical protein